jgi:hypothetical protein
MHVSACNQRCNSKGEGSPRSLKPADATDELLGGAGQRAGHQRGSVRMSVSSHEG